MMSVHNNSGVMFALRMMHMHQATMAQSMHRIASGRRINSAADDAAGLAIVERMQAQIRGMNMATRNVSMAQDLMRTAEGGLNETGEMLRSMRDLVVAAATGTFTDAERAHQNTEFQHLIGGINQIAASTHFNGINLIDGTLGGVRGANAVSRIGIVPPNGGQSITFTETTPGALRGEGTLTIQRDGTGAFEAILRVGEDMVRGTIDETAGTITFELPGEATGDPPIATVQVEINASELREGVVSGIRFMDSPGHGLIGAVGNAVTATHNDNIIFQIGANAGLDQRMTTRIGDMSAIGLGIWDLDILTQANAQAILDGGYLDTAIGRLSGQRAQIGAQYNRLGHTYNNLQTSILNLTEAESTIRDADIAAEMLRVTQSSLLMQASQAAMAQFMQTQQGFFRMMLGMGMG